MAHTHLVITNLIFTFLPWELGCKLNWNIIEVESWSVWGEPFPKNSVDENMQLVVVLIVTMLSVEMLSICTCTNTIHSVPQTGHQLTCVEVKDY